MWFQYYSDTVFILRLHQTISVQYMQCNSAVTLLYCIMTELCIYHYFKNSFISWILPQRIFSEWVSSNELPATCVSLRYLRALIPYLSPIIACASACSHSWKSRTVHGREADIYMNWPSYKGNSGIAHCKLIMKLMLILSALCNSIDQNMKLHKNYLQTSPHDSWSLLLWPVGS